MDGTFGDHTPEEIVKCIDSAAPSRREDANARFVGRAVIWEVFLLKVNPSRGAGM